jgi:GNAT superfamily N-acetyltransferase
MLIDRGAVYTRATAFFASHDRCRCSAEPENDSSPFFGGSIASPAPGETVAVEDGTGEVPSILSELKDLFSFPSRSRLDEASGALDEYLMAKGIVPEGWKIRTEFGSEGFRGHFYDQAGSPVGEFDRFFFPDGEVHHGFLKIDRQYRGQGIATRFNAAMDEVYRSAGYDRITVQANIDVGGYTWAKAGFDWDPDPEFGDDNHYTAQTIIHKIRRNAVRPLTHGELTKLADWEDSLDGPEENWPTPYELAMVGWTKGAKTWSGKEAMLGSNWYGVRRL